eukprot:467746_1
MLKIPLRLQSSWVCYRCSLINNFDASECEACFRNKSLSSNINKQRFYIPYYLHFIKDKLCTKYKIHFSLPEFDTTNNESIIYPYYELILSYLEIWDYTNILCSSQPALSIILKSALPNRLAKQYKCHKLFISKIFGNNEKNHNYTHGDTINKCLLLIIIKLIFWLKCIETLSNLIANELSNCYKFSWRDIQSIWNILEYTPDLFYHPLLLPNKLNEFVKIILLISQSHAKINDKYHDIIQHNPHNITCYNSIHSLFDNGQPAYTRRTCFNDMFPSKFEYKIKILSKILGKNIGTHHFNRYHFNPYTHDHTRIDDNIITDDMEYALCESMRYGYTNEQKEEKIYEYRTQYKNKWFFIKENEYYEKIPTISWDNLYSYDSINKKVANNQLIKVIKKYPLLPMFCVHRYGQSIDFIQDNNKNVLKIILIAG